MLIKHFSHLFYKTKHSLEDADKVQAKPLDIIIHTAIFQLFADILQLFISAGTLVLAKPLLCLQKLPSTFP